MYKGDIYDNARKVDGGWFIPGLGQTIHAADPYLILDPVSKPADLDTSGPEEVHSQEITSDESQEPDGLPSESIEESLDAYDDDSPDHTSTKGNKTNKTQNFLSTYKYPIFIVIGVIIISQMK